MWRSAGWYGIVAFSAALMIAGVSAVPGRPVLGLQIAAVILVVIALLYTFADLLTGLKVNTHLLLARAGLQPPAASRLYVRSLFNAYADSFDHHLMVELSYNVPNLIAGILEGKIRTVLPSVTDLGCGTGICGPLLERYARHMTGVDLSRKMLMQAQRKKCYDELVESGIVEYLHGKRDVTDMCIAADVLVYFGDMGALFACVRRALRHNGFFVFTVEVKEGKGWVLHETGRYAHSVSCIEELAGRNGFSVVERKREILRTQSDIPVPGDVWLLRKA